MADVLLQLIRATTGTTTEQPTPLCAVPTGQSVAAPGTNASWSFQLHPAPPRPIRSSMSSGHSGSYLTRFLTSPSRMQPQTKKALADFAIFAISQIAVFYGFRYVMTQLDPRRQGREEAKRNSRKALKRLGVKDMELDEHEMMLAGEVVHPDDITVGFSGASLPSSAPLAPFRKCSSRLFREGHRHRRAGPHHLGPPGIRHLPALLPGALQVHRRSVRGPQGGAALRTARVRQDHVGQGPGQGERRDLYQHQTERPQLQGPSRPSSTRSAVRELRER